MSTSVRNTDRLKIEAVLAEWNKARRDLARLNAGAILHVDARTAIATANASSTATAVALANAFKAAHNGDCASVVDADTGIGHHVAADATNLITSPDATDQASAITLANEAYGDYNAHVLLDASHAFDTTAKSCSFSVGLLAPAVSMHAQDAGGGALALVAGWTNHLPPRAMTITRGAGGPASVNYSVTMTLPNGVSVVDVVSVAPSGTGTTTMAGVVTSVTTTVDPVSTTDFDTAAAFSVGEVFTGTPVVSCNGVRETLVASHGPSGSVTATTATNGAREFTAQFSSPSCGATLQAHQAKSPTAVDAATLYVRLNDLKVKRNLHVASALNSQAIVKVAP